MEDFENTAKDEEFDESEYSLTEDDAKLFSLGGAGFFSLEELEKYRDEYEAEEGTI